jgi:transposase
LIIDARRAIEVLVGLRDVVFLGVEDRPDGVLAVHVEQAGDRPACIGCGSAAAVKDRPVVELIDLPYAGRPSRLCWHKVRFECPNSDCAMVSWTWDDPRIAAARQALTDRAGRWVTVQVGRYGRSVSELAGELGCSWHTINRAVLAYGEALIDDDSDRIGTTTALGLDETLFCRTGWYRRQHWATSIVDTAGGRLLDVVEGRDSIAPCAWLAARGQAWLDNIAWATLDLSGPYKTVFDTMCPDATQIADPFHLVRLANQRLDEVRRRVQNQTLGHRGHKHDPLYRARRLLTRADERLDDNGRSRLLGLLDAGDPEGEVRTAWHAKEVVRSAYDHHDPDLALEFVTRLGHDLQDRSCPPEIRQLGRTIVRWREQIAAWHKAHLTNAATEAANNLLKRVKRAAFGFTRFRHFRVRALLYAGRPNWGLLATITPR